MCSRRFPFGASASIRAFASLRHFSPSPLLQTPRRKCSPQNFRQPLQVAIIGRLRILRGRLLRRPRGLRRRFVCRSMPSMVRRVPTTTPAVAPVIAPELRPRRPGSETKYERNGDAYANGWHGRTIIQTWRNEFDLSQVPAGIFPMMPINTPTSDGGLVDWAAWRYSPRSG